MTSTLRHLLFRPRTMPRPLPLWRASLTLAACLLLSACANRSGYLNHALAQAAVEEKAPAHDSPAMYLSLLRQMQQQGAYYASLAHIDAFRQQHGDRPELRRMQADALRETGQGEAAGKVYQGLLNSDQGAAAWHGLGLISAASDQYDLAEQQLQKAVQLDPINVAYLGDLGYARLRAGRVASAREPLAKAAELDPTNIKAISNLALWSLLNGDYLRADAIMQRANLPPAARDAVQQLAIQLRTPPPAPAAHVEAPITQPNRAMPRRVAPPQLAGIPDTMLDRFGTPPATLEAQP